jgi:hypothetical protein
VHNPTTEHFSGNYRAHLQQRVLSLTAWGNGRHCKQTLTPLSALQSDRFLKT